MQPTVTCLKLFNAHPHSNHPSANSFKKKLDREKHLLCLARHFFIGLRLQFGESAQSNFKFSYQLLHILHSYRFLNTLKLTECC